MNPAKIACGGLCWLAGLSSSAALEAWQPIDDWTERTPATWVEDIATDVQGRIFTVGHDAVESGIYLNFLRYSLDGGATWSTSSDSLQTGAFKRIVVGPDGYLYAGAGLKEAGTGLARATVDSFQLVSKTGRNRVRDVLAAPDGTLYACGTVMHGNKANLKESGWVRLSRDQGRTWQNGRFPLDRFPNGLSTDPLGNLYALGQWGQASETYTSPDDGMTWHLSDVPGGRSVVDGPGNVYTLCAFIAEGGRLHFQVRRLAAMVP